MTPNEKLNEKVATLAVFNPVSVAASTVVTTWVSMANFHSIVAMIQTGVLGTSATLDAKLRQATDSSGTGAKDITGKAITQIVKATGDNVQASIEARGEDLDVSNGFCYVALSATVGAAASIFAAQLLGCNSRYSPASAFNATTVVQTV